MSRTARARVAVGVLVLAFCATACGIRTTSVPVDAGPAPSRMPCEVPQKAVITQSSPGVPVRVYLECSSELVSVERAARIPAERTPDSRALIAQALLDELQAQPSAAEREAGFTTEVRGPLVVSPGRAADPAGTLRLSRQPEDLPTAALAQIVCTLAESEATDGKVVLGGPGDYPPRGYVCAAETKTRPDAAVPTLGPGTASPSVPAAGSGTASPSA
ncbi:hypothetical protein [Streptomyces liangshanensis]|uniref:hypothetical protein n=1 Tax=Streptomyces liangshanensis TaxID=2717324 RepID=UPI001FBABF1A|nr:hypothetical protein [Streptomyces liangshanensis]